MELKIQFIVTGWHYNQDSLINGLIELLEDHRDQINVFFACHNDPPQKIKDNFEWKQFPNLGLEWGAYEQVLEYKPPEPDTIYFFIQDDLIIKNWDFINVCIDKLNSGKTFIGNCTNYPTQLNPLSDSKLGGTFVDIVKPKNKHLFDRSLNIKTIRGSFICTMGKYINDVDGFESMLHLADNKLTPVKREDGKYEIPGLGGIGGVGNTQLTLFAYKINRVYGHDKIDYLSPRYLDSDYIYECARGGIDNNNPLT